MQIFNLGHMAYSLGLMQMFSSSETKMHVKLDYNLFPAKCMCAVLDIAGGTLRSTY
jgi:hypothetical protein